VLTFAGVLAAYILVINAFPDDCSINLKPLILAEMVAMFLSGMNL